ncbi:MAG: DNA-directed RNA polymerase subunit alpha [Chlamydiota bacterium]
MSVKYGKFELPQSIQMDESKSTINTTRFIAEPFERGFGHTMGNTLRRIMLSSMEAPSVISVRMEGVPHEYMAIEGVIEDVIYILLNFKEALLRSLTMNAEKGVKQTVILSKVVEVTDDQLEKGKGSYKVTLKDLIESPDFEIVNPDLHMFTVTKPFLKRIDIRVGIGRGYVSSERHYPFEKMANEILIDSCFSPVRLVNYYVENTRVGQDTDFDRLILDVTTDGRITPQEALSFASQMGITHLHVFDSLKEFTISFDKGLIEANREKEEILQKLSLKISEIELSVRSTHCLSTASIETIGELVVMSEPEMLKFRNFGKKSLTEIKEKLHEMHLGLGFDLSKFGINRDNVKIVIAKYLEENKGRKKKREDEQ